MHLTRVLNENLSTDETRAVIPSCRIEKKFTHTDTHTLTMKLVKSKTPMEMRKLEEKLSSACCYQ